MSNLKLLVTRSVRCVKRSHVYYRCNYAVGAEEGEIKISCLCEEGGRGEHNGSPHGFSNGESRESSFVTREMVYESINCRNFNHGIQYFLDLAKEDYRRNNWCSVFVWNFSPPPSLDSSILQTSYSRKGEYNFSKLKN